MLFCLSCQGSVFNVDTTKAVTALGLSKLEFIVSKWNWRRMEILIFPLLFRLMVWSGDFDSLINEEQYLGWRGSFFALNKQPFDGLGVSPVVGKAVTSDNLQTAVFLLGFGFCCFFLDSIYKDLTYFLGKFWADIKYSSDVEEASRAPVSDLYSIHFELIVSPLQLNWVLFFMHVFQKIEVSINVIKKIIFFY